MTFTRIDRYRPPPPKKKGFIADIHIVYSDYTYHV